MNYQAFKCNSQKEYLGFCEEKGFIYSVQIDECTYAIVALKEATITLLITFRVQKATSTSQD